MIEIAESVKVEELGTQAIKQILVTALARAQGMMLVVSKIGRNPLDSNQPVPVSGHITAVKVTETAIGFAVEKGDRTTSYLTADIDSRETFLIWLHKANAYAPKLKDYGKGPGSTTRFQRSV